MKYILFFIFMGLTSSISGQVIIQMKREGGVSTIPCKVNGLMLQFIFDTGASEVSMSMTEASFMLKNGYLSADDIIGTANYLDANGDISEGITIRLREIEIGGLKLKDVRASVVKNLKAPLLLGQSALRKLGKIQFDLEENTITITPLLTGAVTTDTTDAEIDTSFVEVTATDTQVVEPSLVPIPQDKVLYENGLRKFFKADYGEAIVYFDMAIAINKTNKVYYLFRALAKDMEEDWKGALIDYNNAIRIDPKYSKAYVYRAETKCKLGDTASALNDLQMALQYDTKNAYAYRERGKIKYIRNNYTSAITDFTLSIKYDPNDCYTYRLRGLAKYYSKAYKSAKLDLDTSIAICEDNAVSWRMRGAAKIELNDLDGAFEDLEKAIELDPESGASYRYMGLIAEQKDFLDEAKRLYEKAVELDPEDFFSNYSLELINEEMKSRIWIPITKSNDGDEWFMKNEIESKEYNIITVWLKVKHEKYTHKENGKSITYRNAYSLYLSSIDCRSKKLRMDYIAIYDSKGKQIYGEEMDFASWEIVPPESMGESVVKEVCSRYY